jgi:ABC-type lipoprotein release transport system permease subunit
LISKGLANFIAGMMFHTNLDFAVDMAGIFVWLVLTLLFGAIASYLPAVTASNLPVRELIEYE